LTVNENKNQPHQSDKGKPGEQSGRHGDADRRDEPKRHNPNEPAPGGDQRRGQEDPRKAQR
jgi:hypothetical protein